jgi:hypothetical protein
MPVPGKEKPGAAATATGQIKVPWMMEDLTQANCVVNSYEHWQADYAAHGVATFPVDASKRPMVSRYNKFGLVASSQIAGKFANAPAIGFMCGRCNGITVLDVDCKKNDEQVEWSPAKFDAG